MNQKTVCIAAPDAELFSADAAPKNDAKAMNKEIADKIINRRADEGAIGFIDRKQKEQREEIKKQFGEKNGS